VKGDAVIPFPGFWFFKGKNLQCQISRRDKGNTVRYRFCAEIHCIEGFLFCNNPPRFEYFFKVEELVEGRFILHGHVTMGEGFLACFPVIDGYFFDFNRIFPCVFNCCFKKKYLGYPVDFLSNFWIDQGFAAENFFPLPVLYLLKRNITVEASYQGRPIFVNTYREAVVGTVKALNAELPSTAEK